MKCRAHELKPGWVIELFGIPTNVYSVSEDGIFLKANRDSRTYVYGRNCQMWVIVLSTDRQTKKPNSKSVIQFDKKGYEVERCESMILAQKATGINYRSIGRVVNGEYKTAGGYIW